jgi:hypothetical protein
MDRSRRSGVPQISSRQTGRPRPGGDPSVGRGRRSVRGPSPSRCRSPVESGATVAGCRRTYPAAHPPKQAPTKLVHGNCDIGLGRLVHGAGVASENIRYLHLCASGHVFTATGWSCGTHGTARRPRRVRRMEARTKFKPRETGSVARGAALERCRFRGSVEFASGGACCRRPGRTRAATRPRRCRRPGGLSSSTVFTSSPDVPRGRPAERAPSGGHSS